MSRRPARVALPARAFRDAPLEARDDFSPPSRGVYVYVVERHPKAVLRVVPKQSGKVILSFDLNHNPIRGDDDEETKNTRSFLRTSLISFAHPARSNPSLHFPVSLYSIPETTSSLISGSGTAIAFWRPPRCRLHAINWAVDIILDVDDDDGDDADADGTEKNDFAFWGTVVVLLLRADEDDRWWWPLLTGATYAAHR